MRHVSVLDVNPKGGRKGVKDGIQGLAGESGILYFSIDVEGRWGKVE
jgi:hypothetical protein